MAKMMMRLMRVMVILMTPLMIKSELEWRNKSFGSCIVIMSKMMVMMRVVVIFKNGWNLVRSRHLEEWRGRGQGGSSIWTRTRNPLKALWSS